MNNKMFKIALFIFLIIILIIIILSSLFGLSLSFLSEENIKSNRKQKNDLVTSFKINGLDTTYDKSTNVHYYMVQEKYDNKEYILKLELDNGYKYKIVNQSLNIIKVNYEKLIDIIIYNDRYYCETRLQLTNLPLINIISEKTITSNDTKSTFTYINTSTLEKQVTSNSIIHTRGGTSLDFSKNSYRVKTFNKKFNKEKNILISNFYYGSSFILDAVYKDPSKVRNLLASTLWNDISDDFTDVDINSEFVEVFVNNEYKGLYVLTEPINRKKLNLNRSDSKNTSVVVKSSGWAIIDEYDNSKVIDNPEYLNYEIKYPNNEEFFDKVWNKFISKISAYYNEETSKDYDLINDTWNLNNYVDIVIFNAFINNLDNQMIKNNYFYMKNLDAVEIYIQPWDMEFSFGLEYSKHAEQYSKKNIKDYDDISLLFYHEDSDEINRLLIHRYWELREKILTKENFNNLLDNYKDLLTKGSAKRDSDTWYEYDIEKEIEEIREWLYNRLEYFDKYVEDIENE